MKITIVDIANKLNITPSTVSRALANNERVSVKTRALVKKTAEEMGYEPNSVASSLRKGTSNTVGMIVPRINRHFFSNAICGGEEVLHKAGYNLTVIQSSEQVKKEIQAIDTLRKGRVAGIILSLSLETDTYDHLNKIMKQLPVVQFDRVCLTLPEAKVINSNYQGAYDATMALVKAGYKRFLHLTGMGHNIVYQERKRGFLTALYDSNISDADCIVHEGALTRDYGQELIKKLWKEESFDAIFSASDYAALGAIEGLTALNVNIPQDVGIVGFANEPFAELMGTPLSTVEQHGEEIGRKAAQAILRGIKEEPIDYVDVVSVEFLNRKSSNRSL